MISKKTKIILDSPIYSIDEIILCVQKALLLTLHEEGKICLNQYNEAVLCLEKELSKA